ncbi:MAG: DNA mismatch repair protein MutS [Sulfuriferula sp.]|nr:DNA mismatch repair protein MutS [Sulfuriferula sp.]
MQSDLKALEFDGIRRIIERLTFTPYGADAARHLEPAPNLGIARQMQAAVTAARQVADAYLLPKVQNMPDIRAALRQANQAGAALPASALHNLRVVMKLGLTLRDLVANYADLYADIHYLKAPALLVEALDKTINAAGRLREDATPELSVMHGQYHEVQTHIESQLKSLMRSAEYASYFDENSRVQWHGMRAVLTVRAVNADKLKGVRRGSSGGGRDVLMEPIEVVAHNNRLETLNAQIEGQNQIVLRATTDVVREHLADLHQLVDGITWIDLALAAGQLSAALNATPPKLVDEPRVLLQQAYHPQLMMQFQEKNISRIVPLDIDLGGSHTMMVITGPNTGGKTVVLKTVGLLVTMAHCGLHLPAEGDCIIGNFNRVIVDVGDKQSLHNHLSTFAGHVEVLKRLLNEADAQTLVLMDELGTGTDPEEGASLAMAVLDELATRKVYGVVTTHLTPLKAFADQHSYLSNASMRFDYATLSPTYQLVFGQAGASLGLIIAEKNGLPSSLIEQARGYLATIQSVHSA